MTDPCNCDQSLELQKLVYKLAEYANELRCMLINKKHYRLSHEEAERLHELNKLIIEIYPRATQEDFDKVNKILERDD